MPRQARSVIDNDPFDTERSSLSAPTRFRNAGNACLKKDAPSEQPRPETVDVLMHDDNDQRSSSTAKSDEPRSIAMPPKPIKEQQKVSIAPEDHLSFDQDSSSDPSYISFLAEKSTEPSPVVGTTADPNESQVPPPLRLTHRHEVMPGAVAIGGSYVSREAFPPLHQSSEVLLREDATIVAEVVDPQEDVEQQVRHITDEVFNRLRDKVVDAELIEKVNGPIEPTASKRRRIFLIVASLIGVIVVVAVVVAVVVLVVFPKQSTPTPLGLPPTSAPTKLLASGFGNETSSAVIANVTNWETCRQWVDTCADNWSCCVAPADATSNKTTCRPPGGSSCLVNVIANWDTCEPGVDICSNSWFCCVAPADVASGKSTCRPGGDACAGDLIPRWSTCRKGLDYCEESDICRVAPADAQSGKTTCRPL